MSRLINPGAGEIADRYTVVALKILFGEAAGKPVEHFRQERTVLLTKLNTREIGPWLDQMIELGAVNAALWHAEDDLRAMRPLVRAELSEIPDWKAVGVLAFKIQELNDHRAKLVAGINKDAGDALGEEKL